MCFHSIAASSAACCSSTSSSATGTGCSACLCCFGEPRCSKRKSRWRFCSPGRCCRHTTKKKHTTGGGHKQKHGCLSKRAFCWGVVMWRLVGCAAPTCMRSGLIHNCNTFRLTYTENPQNAEPAPRRTYLGCKQLKVVTLCCKQLCIWCERHRPLDDLHRAQLVKVCATEQHRRCDVGHMLDRACLEERVFSRISCSCQVAPTTLMWGSVC